MADFAGFSGDTLLVANPVSGRGVVRRRFQDVVDLLRQSGLSPEVIKTAGPGDAEKAARQWDGGLIVVFGGDGTFNEVLNGVDLARCALAVIPAGTGNVLAHELELSTDCLKATRQLQQGRAARYDVGLCNGRRFACVVGAGMDAKIVQMVHERRSGTLTQLHYLPFLLEESLVPTRWCITVEIDGEKLCSDANIVCVGNTSSYGGPISVTPAASPTDGQLDVMATRAENLLEMVQPGVAALLGGEHAAGSTWYGRGRSVTLSSPRPDVPIEVDGDFSGQLPAEIEVNPGAMRLIVP
ncbi:MAG: diacylglycerol/lipid kinase family protein [Candidatus Brocadiia bacterium]